MVQEPTRAMVMTVRPQERVGILIDGWNFAQTCSALDLSVDYEKLRDRLVGQGILVRAAFFLGELAESDEQERFMQRMRSFGYYVVTKPMKTYQETLPDGRKRLHSRCDFAVDFTLQALLLGDRCDRVYLLTGDGDYVPLARCLRDKAVRVITVSSTEKTDFSGRPSRGIIAAELIDASDEFWQLRTIRKDIGKPYRGTW